MIFSTLRAGASPPRPRSGYRLALAALWILTASADAQVFESGSDGSDGALVLSEPGEILFDPQAFDPPLDADGDNIFHFTTINIASGVTVRLTASRLNHQPVVWLASGAVTIAGVVDLSGQPGHSGSTIPGERRPSEPGPGGFAGGIGGFPEAGAPQPGSGPGGGAAGTEDANFRRGAGGRFSGGSFLVPLFGGAGGGGGGTAGSFGAGGGAGGGAILIASSISIDVGGSIRSLGGNGSGSGQSCCNHGGGGSGGAIRLVSPVIQGSGSLLARGGLASRGGGRGKVRLEAFEHAFSGNSDPTLIAASPFGLFIDAIQPAVRVVSVAGVPVPRSPAASFTMPDVTITDGTAVPVEIEARHVPPGTVVKLHLVSENGADQIVDSPPLAGTDELSTATASVEIPPGFSRAFARVTFDP